MYLKFKVFMVGHVIGLPNGSELCPVEFKEGVVGVHPESFSLASLALIVSDEKGIKQTFYYCFKGTLL